MLTKRLIGKLLLNHRLAVQSKGFRVHLPLGRPEIAAEFLDEWGVDEILMLDRTATLRNTCIDTDVVERVVERSRSPLAVGGGIRCVADAIRLVRAGADRIAVNTPALDNPHLIGELARELGQQAIIAVLDVQKQGGEYRVYDYRRGAAGDLRVADWCQRLQAAGVGEICLHSVDRDGAGSGFECDLYQQLRPLLDVPLIASGGFGNPAHVDAVLATEVDAVALGNALHYTEHTVSLVKACLTRYDIRQAGVPGYEKSRIDGAGRLCKLDDAQLEAMRFVKRERQWL